MRSMRQQPPAGRRTERWPASSLRKYPALSAVSQDKEVLRTEAKHGQSAVWAECSQQRKDGPPTNQASRQRSVYSCNMVVSRPGVGEVLVKSQKMGCKKPWTECERCCTVSRSCLNGSSFPITASKGNTLQLETGSGTLVMMGM